MSVELNDVRRLSEAARPKTLRSLPVGRLTLQIDLQADCNRYDSSRGGHRHDYWPLRLTESLATSWYGHRLAGMAGRIHRPAKAGDAGGMLDRLIAAEQVDRHARSLNYQLHIAKLPHQRDLVGFDW